MQTTTLHSFHIPVLGLSYSIDTPLKVARFGISSVVSVVEDGLIEHMRAYHSRESGEEYVAITVKDADYRAKRITEYLNLLGRILDKQMKALVQEPFVQGNDIVRYFELLPNQSLLRKYYEVMQLSSERSSIEALLRKEIKPGAIDVNIMSKIDNGVGENSDALAALRGIANCNLSLSVVFSAGYNPRLYNYIENFECFFPDEEGHLDKKVILKVSDYRSAMVQGKLLAKKGIWVSEFRIESGLNCGGHAFATEGILLGPILEEFKSKRLALAEELLQLCNNANKAKGRPVFTKTPPLKITVQGGIGTAEEDVFLMDHYQVDGTGWGSPFLLVPEATNVEEHTLQLLATASPEDYFLSDASPLGVTFQNFRKSTGEDQRQVRINKDRPGSPCYKKFLATDTEFTEHPICTASRQYQALKLKQPLSDAEREKILAKDCLCEGLSTSVYLKNGMPLPHQMKAVTICPGPNLAWFSGTFSLKEMVDHIYGRVNVIKKQRPHMFVNEAWLYIDYLKKAVAGKFAVKDVAVFKNNLVAGLNYYLNVLPQLKKDVEQQLAVLHAI